MHYLDLEGKKILWAAKVQLVWYMMWDPNICLQEAVFFFPQLSLSLSGTGGDPGRIPWRLHNRVGVATPHKPRGLLTLHCPTMRSEEDSFFRGTKEWFFTRPVRTAANNELSGPWYHVRFHTRQLHSGAEQKGSRRNICGEGTVCPGHAMEGEFDAFQRHFNGHVTQWVCRKLFSYIFLSDIYTETIRLPDMCR